MKGNWIGILALSLGLQVTGARAQEYRWLPAAPRPPESLRSAVMLGRPTPQYSDPAPAGTVTGLVDRRFTPASYSPAALSAPQPIIRAQAPDPVVPTPAPAPPPPGPPPIGGIPVSPAERYNCGVVTEPPDAGRPFLPGGHGWLDGCKNLFGGLFTGGTGVGRSAFQSDHGFDQFSSPVSNPFLFEDPRALTEVRPIFIAQGTPRGNAIFHGGDIEFFGLQGRLAFTDRLSLVLNEVGVVWIEPHNGGGEFASHDGFAEFRIGPKYTFYRCEQTGTVAAAGLTFDIPFGSHAVFQNTGTLSLEPYVSFGQTFGKSSFGSFNFLGTLGYSVATDNKRTDFLFTSLHLDYNIGNLNIIYPFLELNYFGYTSAGKARNLGFEGRDLFNFGSMGVSGNSTTTMAVGARYKFSERLQAGAAYEFPLGGHRDLLDYRFTFDLIFRY
jgi:hypothetical protein